MAKKSAAFTFSPSFQENMLALMTKDVGFAIKAADLIPTERLYSEAHKYMFEQLKKVIKTRGDVPSFIEIEDGLKELDASKRRMLQRFCKNIYSIAVADPEFVKEKCTEYARKSSFIEIFQDAQTLWNSGKPEHAYARSMEGFSNLYSISFHDDTNIPIEEFEAIRQRYLLENAIHAPRIPTNIAALDQILRGGLEKGELGILLAEPKKGKSIGLTHMGCMAIMMRFGRVAHFLLEGTTEQGILRYESRLTGIPYSRLEKDEISHEESDRIGDIRRKYAGRLEMIPMNKHWNYTVLDVESKLKELQRAGKMPDLVVVDYGDLLKSSTPMKEKRHEQTEVFRDLKRLAVMYKVAIWTASQAKRPENEPEKEYLLRAKDIAENFEKVRIADLICTLNQTPKERGEGVLRLHVDVYRSNDHDRTIRMICDFSRMIFHSKRYGCISGIPGWMVKKGKRA